MTEDEVKVLEETILNKPIAEDLEQLWLKTQLTEMSRLEGETMCLFKFNKFMGKHAEMKQNEAAIAEIRQALAYLEKERSRYEVQNP